jgi:hypothetical protein
MEVLLDASDKAGLEVKTEKATDILSLKCREKS